ncbi:MAG: HNH endonuclease [Acidimicrobiia bacterium]|nr:HNH endonuclease [Acidimicrobiia bacterium]
MNVWRRARVVVVAGPRVLRSPRRWLAQVAAHRRADGAARANRNAGTHCFYCDVLFGEDAGVQRTIDHRVPRSRGGRDVLANMVFACRACNERKADVAEADFVASQWLAERRGQRDERQ